MNTLAALYRKTGLPLFGILSVRADTCVIMSWNYCCLMKKNISIAFFLFSLTGSFAQNAVKMDSLTKALTSARDTQKVKIFIALSNECRQVSNYPEALKFGERARTFSDSIAYLDGSAEAGNIIGSVHYEQGNYSKAQASFTKVLELVGKKGNKKITSVTYGSLGTTEFYMGNYAKALEYQLIALRQNEETGNKRGMANCYNRIGNVYLSQVDYKNAMKYYEKALEIFTENGLKKGMAIAYNNIGIIHGYQKEKEKELNCYILSLKLREEIGDRYGIADSRANIGDIYFADKNYSKALEYYFKALAIRKEIAEKLGLASTYNKIATVYTEQYKFDEARNFLTQGLALGNVMQRKETIKDTYKRFSELYSKPGDCKLALEYFKKYTEVKDTLFNAESSKNIAQMQAQYDSEKKDNEIILLNKDKEKQAAVSAAESSRLKFITGSVTTGLLLVLAFAIFVFRSYRQKRFANATLSRAYVQLEQKNQQITDSIFYARRIQQAILPPEKTVKEIFPQSFIFFQPKDIVSGDFYWMEKKGDLVFLALADCTGHGVPGAFMSMIGNTLLNEIVNEKHIYEPSNILHELNTGIIHALHQNDDDLHSQDDGMDISVCVINKNKKEIVFAGAGHHLFMVNDEGPRLIEGDLFPIGKMSGGAKAKFTDQRIEIKNNTSIYLYSDGYTDQFGGERNKKFGSSSFETLLSSVSILGLEEQRQKIELEFSAWKEDRKQTDDVSVVGIRIVG